MPGSVLVFVEQREGKIHPASLQMFTAARELAPSGDGALHAVIAGDGIGPAAEIAARHGADLIYLVDDPELRLYAAAPYTRAVCAAIEKDEPDIVLMATTSMARDLAPRVAARVKGALATDCIEVERADGGLRIKRPMYCAKCVGEFALADDRLKILSVRPNIYSAAESAGAGAPNVTTLPADLSDQDKRARAIEVVRADSGVKELLNQALAASSFQLMAQLLKRMIELEDIPVLSIELFKLLNT